MSDNGNGKSNHKALRQKVQNRFAEQEQQEKERKYLNAALPRKEFMPFAQDMQTLKTLIGAMELMITSYHRVMINKDVATEDEINAAIKYEQERAKKWKEIKESKGPYEKRLELCKEWEIDPKDTGIPVEIEKDTTLTPEQKQTLRDTYGIPHELAAGQKN